MTITDKMVKIKQTHYRTLEETKNTGKLVKSIENTHKQHTRLTEK